jgi:hypothetical protein
MLLWAFGAAGATGLVLGFWFRVPALLVASFVTAAIYLPVAPFAELGTMATVGVSFALLGVLQAGYLRGLTLSCAWSRAARWLCRTRQSSRSKGASASQRHFLDIRAI